MPDPNEHSARLIEPPTNYIRVRRSDGSGKGLVQGVKVPSTIGVIWYIVRKNGEEVPIPQALRFPTKNWTEARARKWLKDNKIKYKRFEPARKETDKHCLDEPRAPVKACLFNAPEENALSFAESGEKPGFSIIGYSGGIIKDHFYWGDVAFDLSGLKFAKKRTPVLEEHFTSRRIGFATRQEISDKVIFEGEFLENDGALAMAKDLRSGFPMEASLYVPPSVVERVEKGASAEVNGKTLKGPGAVFRQAVIREVSMCVFGADSNTRSMAYADNDNNQVKFNFVQEKKIMAEETLTIETFGEQYPDLRDAVFADGKAEGKVEAEQAARDRFAQLQKVCGDDAELIVQCLAEGKDPADASQMRLAKLQAQNTELANKLAEAEKTKIDPAVSEFRDQAPAPGATDKFDEAKATPEQLKAHYAQTQQLQDEFHSVEAYVAYVQKEVQKGGRS